MRIRTLLIAFVALLVSASAYAQTSTITLAWDPYPSPGSILGFNIYELVGSQANLVVNLTTPTTTQFTTSGIAPGTHTYQMTAYNSVGESGPSNQASVSVPQIPTAPTNLRANIVSTP